MTVLLALIAFFVVAGIIMVGRGMAQYSTLRDDESAVSVGIAFYLFGMAIIAGIVGLVHG